FENEYIAHIKDKRCPAKVCKALIKFQILPDKCTGCMKCADVCPQKAITGARKKVHVINQ
ncbi:MAG: 4Fe-4S binding protein, partial [candidate division WOR-3 bacterium]|nr:4Fe-4S binding protein [candidate division WOR-3 bacterium]